MKKRSREESISREFTLIWLLLVGQDGLPFKGTTVSSVVRSSLVVPVVDPFRKAVKAENPIKLSAFDASDLQVYKNKEAFDKRNAQEGK